VREKRWLSLPEAVRKMTGLPAAFLGLRDRGILRKGSWADITVFDPGRISERATYDEPRLAAHGIDYVVVNGKLAVSRGKVEDVQAGRVLRGG